MPLDPSLSIDLDNADLSPWLETPSSSRVARMRYDHGNRATQVQWTNGKNRGYVYGDFTYEGLIQRYNSDLANNLGNLAARVATVVGKKCGGLGTAPAADSPLAFASVTVAVPPETDTV